MNNSFTRSLTLILFTGLTIHITIDAKKHPKKHIKIEKKQTTKKHKTKQKSQKKEENNTWWQPVTRIFEKQEAETIAKEFRTQAKHVAIKNIQGNITIRTWPYEKVVIEMNKKGHRDNPCPYQSRCGSNRSRYRYRIYPSPCTRNTPHSPYSPYSRSPRRPCPYRCMLHTCRCQNTIHTPCSHCTRGTSPNPYSWSSWD